MVTVTDLEGEGRKAYIYKTLMVYKHILFYSAQQSQFCCVLSVGTSPNSVSLA